MLNRLMMTHKLIIFLFLACCNPILLVAQSNPNNGYIRKWVPQKPIDNAADVITVSENNPDAVRQVTTYYDGFGRPVQTVSKQAGPQDKDIVTLHLYDNFGRETKKYLPFVSGSGDGDYKDNALSALNGFNQTMYPDEGNY